uniref:Uncharacterized protein n=1 Tax=Rhizophora mucronata TaxID=61149 RepID=A0A2P2QAR3_RHIMU
MQRNVLWEKSRVVYFKVLSFCSNLGNTQFVLNNIFLSCSVYRIVKIVI